MLVYKQPDNEELTTTYTYYLLFRLSLAQKKQTTNWHLLFNTTHVCHFYTQKNVGENRGAVNVAGHDPRLEMQ